MPSKKAKLTRIAFNPKQPVVLVGDEKGRVTLLKLSPNLRRSSAPVEGKTLQELEEAKMDRIIQIAEKSLRQALKVRGGRRGRGRMRAPFPCVHGDLQRSLCTLCAFIPTLSLACAGGEDEREGRRERGVRDARAGERRAFVMGSLRRWRLKATCYHASKFKNEANTAKYRRASDLQSNVLGARRGDLHDPTGPTANATSSSGSHSSACSPAPAPATGRRRPVPSRHGPRSPHAFWPPPRPSLQPAAPPPRWLPAPCRLSAPRCHRGQKPARNSRLLALSRKACAGAHATHDR